LRYHAEKQTHTQSNRGKTHNPETAIGMGMGNANKKHRYCAMSVESWSTAAKLYEKSHLKGLQ